MNPLYLLPIFTIAFIFAGIYFMFFLKKDKARSFVNQLFDDSERKEQMKRLQQQQFVLKKRRKDQSKFMQKLDIDIERANLMLKPNEFLMISLGCAVFAFLIASAMNLLIVLSILVSAIGFFIPKMFLALRIMLRMKKAQAQFADVLDMMVGCFKSGYGFGKAVQVVGDNYDDPWSTELTKVAAEMNFGASQDDALFALAKRVPNPDVALFVTAILIQKDTGGNLAELLSNLSHTIRERYKLLSKVSALSAQGKLSGIIVFLVPIGLAGIFSLIIPDLMKEFISNPIGKVLMGFALFMQIIGGIVLKKIVTLEV